MSNLTVLPKNWWIEFSDIVGTLLSFTNFESKWFWDISFILSNVRTSIWTLCMISPSTSAKKYLAYVIALNYTISIFINKKSKKKEKLNFFGEVIPTPGLSINYQQNLKSRLFVCMMYISSLSEIRWWELQIGHSHLLSDKCLQLTILVPW